MRRPLLTRSLLFAALLAATSFASGALADAAAADPAEEAARRHFAQQGAAPAQMPGAEESIRSKGNDPASSPDAMVAYFTEEIEDTTVAARRRHVDLDIKFEFDSADLSGDGIQQLDTAGQALNDPALQSHRFMLAGHTDDVGDPTYNRTLSQKRAESAKRYLIEKHGISAERLETAGFGSEHPKETGSSPEARKRNRRVALEMVE